MEMQRKIRINKTWIEFIQLFEQFVSSEDFSSEHEILQSRRYIGRDGLSESIYLQPVRIFLGEDETTEVIGEIRVFNDKAGVIITAYSENDLWPQLENSWRALEETMKLNGFRVYSFKADRQNIYYPPPNDTVRQMIEFLYLLYLESRGDIRKPVLINAMCPSYLEGINAAKLIIHRNWAVVSTNNQSLTYNSYLCITPKGADKAREFGRKYNLLKSMIPDDLRTSLQKGDAKKERKYRIDWKLIEDELKQQAFTELGYRTRTRKEERDEEVDETIKEKELWEDEFLTFLMEDRNRLEEKVLDYSWEDIDLEEEDGYASFLQSIQYLLEDENDDLAELEAEILEEEARVPTNKNPKRNNVNLIRTDKGTSQTEVIRNTPLMRKHYKDYSPERAIEILENVEGAWERFCIEGGRWGPGKFTGLVTVTATTTGRYIKAFKAVGITQWKGIDLP